MVADLLLGDTLLVISKTDYKPANMIIHRGYSNFWSAYDIYFIEWSEKCLFLTT